MFYFQKLDFRKMFLGSFETAYYGGEVAEEGNVSVVTDI
jgi:hypothetical protein